jgi:hypothetical protein
MTTAIILILIYWLLELVKRFVLSNPEAAQSVSVASMGLLRHFCVQCKNKNLEALTKQRMPKEYRRENCMQREG